MADILAKLVLLARASYEPEHIILCPRNVAYTNRSSINSIYNAIKAEEKGQSNTKYQRLLSDLDKSLNEFEIFLLQKILLKKVQNPELSWVGKMQLVLKSKRVFVLVE